MTTEKKKGKNGGARPGSGRKPAEVDWEIVKVMCAEFCTHADVAGCLGLSPSGFDSALKRAGIVWSEFYAQHSAGGRRSLRSRQKAIAEAGDTKMLIWLGKQYLDQKDKQEVGFDPDKPVLFKLSMGKDISKKEDPDDEEE